MIRAIAVLIGLTVSAHAAENFVLLTLQLRQDMLSASPGGEGVVPRPHFNLFSGWWWPRIRHLVRVETPLCGCAICLGRGLLGIWLESVASARDGDQLGVVEQAIEDGSGGGHIA
jgi:hypothetical protein